MCQNDCVNIKWIVLLTVLLGGFLLVKQVNDYNLSENNNLLEHVRIVSGAMNVDRIQNLYADERDYQNPDYLKLKDQLTNISNSIDGIRYVYLMAKKGDKTVLLVDTQPDSYGLEGLAEPGEVYEEMDNDVEQTLKNKSERVTKPYTDKWGTFISGLSSITEKDSSKVVALVGMDTEVTKRRTRMWQSLMPRTLIIILIVIIELVVFSSQKKNAKNYVNLAYLASVLESSEDAIYSIDFDKKILSWNLGAEKLYGYTQDEVLGRDMTGILLPDGEVSNLDQNLVLIAKGRRLGNQTLVRKTRLGKLIDVSIILSPIFDNQDRITSVSVIARDITKQKQIDDNLEKHNLELEKMNRLMIDRELVMMELKKKIKQYETKN